MLTPIITAKQLEILLLLYKFRFLNRQQIQTMLNHKYPSKVKVWLADLTKKRIIARTYSRKFGENTKPAVYFLDIKSRDLLKENPEVIPKLLKKIYQEKTRSQYFRENSMFIADICLNLKSQTQEGTEFHFFTKTQLEGHQYLYKPLPDAYIAVKDKENSARYFLEVVSKQTPRFILRKRIENLFKYYVSGKWAQNSPHPFPKILIVCPDYVTKAFLSKFIAQTRDSKTRNFLFYLATEDVIKAAGIKPDIWQKVE